MPDFHRSARFSLKALLIAMGIVAIGLGYSQWRRQTMLQDYAALRADGVQFVLPNAWIDRVWQRHPDEIVLMTQQSPTEEDDARFDRISQRLERMGASNIQVRAPLMEWPK